MKRLGLYKTNLYSRIACCIAYIPAIFGVYIGNFALIVIGELLYYVLQGPYLGTSGALIGKICEYSKIKDGIDVEATVSSCNTMGTKLGNALGVAMVGWLLSAAHYDGMLSVQPDSALSMIKWIFVWVPFILQIIITIILSQMNVEKGHMCLAAVENIRYDLDRLSAIISKKLRSKREAAILLSPIHYKWE